MYLQKIKTGKRYFMAIWLFFYCQGIALGQAYNFVNYGIPDGLVQSEVTDICQDQFGNLWIATQRGGLSKFNGVEFTSLTIKDGLLSNYVRSVIADKKGNIWAATAQGISKFDGKSITNYTFEDAGEMQRSVNKIFEGSNGTIWFSSPTGGISRINQEGEIEQFDLDNGFTNDPVMTIAEDDNQVIWIVTRMQGLYKMEENRFEKVIGSDLTKGFLLSMLVDGKELLLGTTNGMLSVKRDSPKNIASVVPQLEGVFIKELVKDNEGNIWIVSANGVLCFDGQNVRQFNKEHGFTNETVSKAFKDREGTLWFGTHGKGIFKYQGEVFSYLDKAQGLCNSNVTSITKDHQGNYWFSTYGGGIDKYDGKTFMNYNTSNDFFNNYVSSSALGPDGSIWFGTSSNGLVKYDGISFKSYTTKDGLLHNSIREVFWDEQNNLWISTRNGLSLFKNGVFRNFLLQDGLLDNVVWGILELDDGRILIVTRKGFNIYENGKMKTYYVDDAVFSKRVNVVALDKHQNFWIGYSGFGVCRMDISSGLKDCYTVEDGLASNLIYNLIFDDEDNLFVGTERGVDKISFNKDGSLLNIKNFNQEGFRGIETNVNAVYKEPDGSIWFGTKNGVHKYHSAEDRINEIEPITYISDVKLFYNKVNWDRRGDCTTNWYDVPVNLVLPHNENNLVISYFGNSLRNPNNVSYQFQLVGFDKNWSPVTNRTTVAYTNLAPGEYEFRVKAANSDGVWSTKPAVFSFEIVPPFWQRGWFYLLCLVIFFTGARLIYNYRIKVKLDRILTVEKIRAEEQVKVRKRMARDFHDNMGNQLASITVFTNLISLKLKDKSKDIDDLLKNIEKHTKSLFNGTKDFIWSIDPESDDLEELFTYIKDFGEDLFASTEIHFYANAEKLDGKSYGLPSGWSRQIVLIFKEAMTNALKHSKCSEVHYDINLLGNEFVIKLYDNGQGLVNGQELKGNGFKNMKTRATQIGCNLEINAHNGQTGGLEILFTGKL